MVRVTWLLLAVPLVSTWTSGCGEDTRGLEWVIQTESDDLTARITFVEARIVDGGCAGDDDVYTTSFALDGAAASMEPPELDPGNWGFSARAHDGDCRWIADGCVEVELPRDDDRVVVVLREIAGSAACPADECMDGICEGALPDAGPPDAGPGDAGPEDGGGMDAGPEDAGMVCDPGETEMVSCGMCGTAERTCSDAGRWTMGACEGEGVCPAGETTTMTCGMAGDVEVTCSDSCTLPATCPVDVMLLVDVTGSHYTDVSDNEMRIADELVGPLLGSGNVRVGISYFADYPTMGHGSTGDVPFAGLVQPTADTMALSDGLSMLPMLAGADASESGLESLFVLAGGMPHADSMPFSCMGSRVDGGCWRPTSKRAVVIVTDEQQHNGPDPSGGGFVDPYAASIGAPTWSDVQMRMMGAGVDLFAVATDDGSAAQLRVMAMDLGQDPADCIAAYPASSSDFTMPLRDVLGHLQAYYGL